MAYKKGPATFMKGQTKNKAVGIWHKVLRFI